MRHRVYGKKLGRNGSERKALKLILTRALLEHGRIRTCLLYTSDAADE